jgi:glycosyltransferase involved in cell wall biosynthesis
LNLCPEPKVSVVIPALNEEKELGECLASLAGQVFPEFEVIVVDNGSTDKTSSLAEEWGARVVFEGRRGPGYAREAGFRAARAPIIASTDADTVLPPHWVFRIHEAFQEDPEAIAVFGPIRAKPLSAPTSLSQALLPVLETTVVFGQRLAMYARAPLFSGANFAVRREAFFQVPNYLIPSFNLAGEPIRIMLAARKLRGRGRENIGYGGAGKTFVLRDCRGLFVGSGSHPHDPKSPTFPSPGALFLGRSSPCELCPYRSLGPPFLGPKRAS